MTTRNASNSQPLNRLAAFAGLRLTIASGALAAWLARQLPGRRA